MVFKSLFSSLAAVALLAASAPATAAVLDAADDFLATYTGPQNADLDILAAGVVFNGTDFRFSATLAGPVGATPGSLYVWGINRGGGTPRLTFGSPSIGSSALFDAVAVFFPNGVARAVTFPSAGPPTITVLNGAAQVDGDTIGGIIPVSLFPSAGFAPEDYTFTLWSRKRVDPAADGFNSEIADFAPNLGGMRAAVPEPGVWALMILGFAAAGTALRAGRLARCRVQAT